MPKLSNQKRAKFTRADKRTLNKVKRAINNRELKLLGTPFNVAPSTAVTIVPIADTVQSLDSDGRIGDVIMPSHMEVRGTVELHASATRSHVRMMIVRDNSGTTTVPVITDLFTSNAQFMANKSTIGDSQSRGRFTILWDKWVQLDQIAHGEIKSVVMRKKLAKKAVVMTGPAITDGGINGLYLFFGSSEVTNDPIVNMTCHLWYTD